MDLLWVVFAVLIYAQENVADDPNYKAGVYEHYPEQKDKTVDQIIKTNIETYRETCSAAKSQEVKIVVFPEYGLTTLVTDPTDYALEISDTYTGYIKELSDMAKENGLYTVVNLLEKVQDSNKKTKYYNTNLVFSPNGTIILKYRKINLNNEDKLTPGDSDQKLTFTTNFNVTFGIFTSSDIYFDNPSRQVLVDRKVTDIVFPSAWSSVVPFHTALTVQHGYAIANGVNLLAASYRKPSEGYGGSGIYLYDGTIADSFIDDTASSKRIIASVQRISERVEKTVCSSVSPYGLPGVKDSNVSDFVTKRNWNAKDYTFVTVDLSKSSEQYTVCDGEFCCNFKINVEEKGSSDFFKIMAFDGIEESDDQRYHTRYCSLVACKSDDISSCGDRVNTTTKFKKITVDGNLVSEKGTFYVPITLNNYLLPIQQTSYCNNANGTNNQHYIQFTTRATSQYVLAFGIFGKTVNSASSIQVFSMFAFLLFTAIKNFVL